ncbi:MAG: zinc-ribbon domain-containing protein, partial [Myxococcales bacterium]
MIKVSCPSCNASYDVDENRLPEDGLRMRCPKCEESFQVHRDGTTAKTGGGAAPASKRPPARKPTQVGIGPNLPPPAPPPPPAAAKPPVDPPGALSQGLGVDYGGRVQELAADGGPMTLWYGQSGVDVSFNESLGLRAENIKDALKSLAEVADVSVSG